MKVLNGNQLIITASEWIRLLAAHQFFPPAELTPEEKIELELQGPGYRIFPGVRLDREFLVSLNREGAKALLDELLAEARRLIGREKFDSDQAYEQAIRETARDWIYWMLTSTEGRETQVPKHIQPRKRKPGPTGTQPLPVFEQDETPSGRIRFREKQPRKASCQVEISFETLIRIGQAAGWAKTAGEMSYGTAGSEVPISHIKDMLKMLSQAGLPADLVPRFQALYRRIVELSEPKTIEHIDLKNPIQYPTVTSLSTDVVWELLKQFQLEWTAQYIMPAFDPSTATPAAEPESQLPISAPAEDYDQDTDTAYYQRSESEPITLRVSKSDWEEFRKAAKPRDLKLAVHHVGRHTCLASIMDGDDEAFVIDIDDADPAADNRTSWGDAWNEAVGSFDLDVLKKILVDKNIMNERDRLTQ